MTAPRGSAAGRAPQTQPPRSAFRGTIEAFRALKMPANCLVFVDDPWDWGIVLKPTFLHQNQQIHVEQYTNCMTFYGKKCNVSTINTHRSCLAPNLAISCDELKPKYWEPCDPKLPELRMHGNKLPSLKLTASLPLKMDGWTMKCPFGARPMFRGYVSFREGRPLKSPCQEI